MPAEIKHKTRKTIALAVVVLVLLLLAGWGIYWYTAKNKSYYTVGIIYNSVNLQPDDLDVIQLLLRKRVAEINDAGGIAGKPIRLRYLDDKGSRETVYKIVQESVQDESLIGYIGCWSSTRVQAAAGVVGKAGVPFIGGYSVTAIAEPYPNMFSYEMEVSRVAFVIHNLVKSKAKKLALIANAQDIYSQALFNEIHRLAKQDMGYSVVLEKWYPNEHSFSPDELNNLTDSLQQSADFVLLSANPKHTNILVSAIGSRHLSIPVFTAFSDIPEIDPKEPGFKTAELYDVSVFGIPSALNLRNQELEARFKKQLKQSPRLQFQLGLGGLHADALGLLKEASELEINGKQLPIRQQISRGLSEYINGKKVFRGWFSDWYFTPDRALVNEVLVGWKPEHQQLPLLAPQQFLRSDTGLQQAPVLYTQIDLQELDQVNEENGTFHASFFLEIQSEDTVNLKQIDFVNAVRNNVNQKPLLEARLLQEQQNATHQNMFYYMYAVTGQFQFQPDLRQYPFDQQRFPIVLQTNSALRPFLIQPPVNQPPQTGFTSQGWKYKTHFVGFDQDLIYSGSSIMQKPRHLPYYKFSYTYVLKRTKVDFFLKVLTPLLVLLVVTYFSVFIPIREFVTVAVIQVTALLSAIALYFSAYKPQMAAATTSDKIFIFTYIMITTTIGTSVLEYWLYRRRRSRRKIGVAVAVYERILFPIIILGFTLFLAFLGGK